jgi:hypothetical protein
MMVQVTCTGFGIHAVKAPVHEGIAPDGGERAHCPLLLRRVFNNPQQWQEIGLSR